ncbi:FG-GAP-like repeat-containing protein [Desulfobacula toluolica]|uniref:Conserved uncharacterized protein n=1 Tax=Desulfobacula toluolica (strain DSM 7467 / Tol2) TaxID=651182 RepID=K0NNH9_DESTT|nr:FG-GAP-like repeat-containing protein [Desulfobacula toluolica]CCK81543.1 conserved uncharacterized protein [Desulfobacula toluolica Tol2]
MNNNYLKFKLFIIFFFLIFPDFVCASLSEKKIVVSPFKIESQENLEFLEKGVVHMLETRLKVPGHSSVVFSSDNLEIESVKADYLLEGTILVFGDSVSTDAKLINASSGEIELVFSQFGNKKGDVLKHIDLFAEQIRTDVLNLAPRQGNTGVSEKTARYVPYAEPQKPVIWRSPSFDTEMKSIAVADIDNDSKNETIVLSSNMLSVFQRTGNSFKKMSELRLASGNKRHLFVDVVDLDADGTQEIFVTGINDDTLEPDSILYHWNTSGLIKVADHIKWLFRAVDTKSYGRILLGQKTRGEGERRLKTGITRLKMDESGQLSPAELSLPFADNIFGLAFGDFMNNGKETIAVLNLKGTLSLYSFDGRELFTSADTYGGSGSYVEYKGMRYNRDSGYQMSRIYLQQRLFASDLDQDGKTSLVTVKNQDAAKGLLSRLRVYNKGNIESLLWNEMGMAPKGRTQTVSGYICDYTIADMDNNGKKEVIFAIVSSKGVLQKKISRIVSQSFIVKGMMQPF